MVSPLSVQANQDRSSSSSPRLLWSSSSNWGLPRINPRQFRPAQVVQIVLLVRYLLAIN